MSEMMNLTDLVKGQKNSKVEEREKKKAELGVCRIRKLSTDGKGYLTVGSGSVIRNVLIDWPGYKDKICLVTTDKVLPDKDFDVKDFVLDFRKSDSTLREFKLANYANRNAVFRFTSGLVVIPLDPKGFETVTKRSIFTFRPFTREYGSSGKLFCPTLEDTDEKHFTVRKDFALTKHLEDQLGSNKYTYVLYDEHSSVSFSTLGGFIGTSNRKPHGAVILSDKECKAVGVLYCPHDQPTRISPIWLSQDNLNPSSVGSPEVVVELPSVKSSEAAKPHSNEQPLHNEDVEVSGTDKEDAATLSKKSLKKSRSNSESTSDPGSSSENDNVQKVDSPAEQKLVAVCRTLEQQLLLDEEKKASATNNPDTVIKCSFQDLSDEQHGIVRETLERQIQVYIEHHDLAARDGVDGLIEHIKETHHLVLKSVGVKCLVINVQCPTLESLESLWKDYCSGHLNEVAERYLVTNEIKRKLNLETVKLKTTIEEENYLICKKALMEKSRKTGSTDISTEHCEPDQGVNARWTDTSFDFPKLAINTSAIPNSKAMAQQDERRAVLSRSISDIVDDLRLLKVSTYGYDNASSMEEARELKIQELKTANGTLYEGYEKILKDLKEARDRRKILQHYYLKIKDVLKDTKDTCPQENADFLVGAEECIKDLNSKKFTILIAGETSAGKSSLINLLLNDRVLPTAITQNTFTICEISYGAKREAVIYFAKPGKTPLKLKDFKFDTIKQNVEKPKDDEHWCKKIEIKIPNPLLKGGVVIVDSPGIGDSEQVSTIALEYLPQACAFIYVINSSNAGGLQEDRLMRILEKWIQLYEGYKCRGLTADSALFVCNKWDDVERQTSQSDKEKLQKDIVSKLKKKIPQLDEKSQLITMSVYRAALVLKKFGVLSEDVSSLINGITRLLPLCIEKKTEYLYCWINGHLTGLSDQIKAEVKNARRNRDERLKAREEVEVKLEKLKQGASIQETEEALSNHVKRISVHVQSYLQSDDVRRAFCTWKEKDLPQIDDGQRGNIVQLKEIYNKCIEKRLEAFIQNLEKQENLFAKAHADLKERFHRGFFEFEKDIRDIDRVLVGESMDEFMPFAVSPDKLRPPLDPRVKKFLFLTSVIFMPILFPIGLAAGVLSAPVIGYLAIEKHLKEKHLKNDACQALTELSTEFLQAFIEHEVVNRVLQEFTQEKDSISSVRRCHRELVDKYEKRCKDLTKSEDEAKGKEIVQTLAPLYTKLEAMNETLMFDAIQHGIQVMYPSCQIDKKKLDCFETPNSKIGRGSYGNVYRGKLSRPGHARKDVAVKKLKETPHPSSVATFLGEASMLMQLQHKYIVAFYGVVMDVHNHKLSSLALVFELCNGSLTNHIFKNKTCIPWKTASAASAICQWSKEILDAMEFIHSKKIVHRDLKLDNVLISRREHIKLADLGLATFKGKITGTMCGTPLYMAPEVHEGKVYDSKADIYSFGLMMWEMWFGERVPLELSSLSQDKVFQRIEKERYRGEERGVTFNPPPTKWIEMMVTCWDYEPCLRKTATECKDLIKEIKHSL